MADIEIGQFQAFPKIPRLNRDVVLTEKLDGTSGQILIEQLAPNVVPLHAVCIVRYGEIDHAIFAGSRSRWLNAGKNNDNFGFAKWVHSNAPELVEKLGPGRHYGEWWGHGIQRGYGIDHKRFSLFNVKRWSGENRGGAPDCCSVVPILYQGPFDTAAVYGSVDWLIKYGSLAAPGFDRPEGVVVYHTAGNHLYKMTIDGDDQSKSVAAAMAMQEAA